MAGPLSAAQLELIELQNSIKQIELRNVEALVEIVNDANGDIVCLHVGGKRCTTTRATLRRFPDSMLAIMFSGRYPLDYLENGDIYLNRDYKYFRHVLNFLRTPAYKFGRDYVWFLKDQQPDEYWRIADEFDYFGIPWSPDERLPNLMEDAVSRPVGTAGEAATAIACTTFTGGAWLGAPTMALVAGGVSGQVAIWSVDSHGGTSSLAKIQGHTTFITAVACSPSGLVVCYYAHMQQMSGAKDGTCILWRNLTVAHAYQLQTERQGILSVAVDADHHAYVYQPSGEAYKMLTVHSMDGTVRRSIAVDRPYVCLLPSGMVAGIIDGRANIWDIKTGEAQELPVSFEANRIVSDGCHIVAVCNFKGNQCAIWDTKNAAARTIYTDMFGLRAVTDDALIGVKLGTFNAVIRPLDSAKEIVLAGPHAYPIVHCKKLGSYFIVSMSTDGSIRIWRPAHIPREHVAVCGRNGK